MNNSLLSGKEGTVKLVYILYLVSLLTGGLTFIIGVVIAYMNKDDSEEWLQSHYHFQIRTFWIGVVFMGAVGLLFAIGTLLLAILVGFLIVPIAWVFFWLTFIWLVIRCVKGIKQVDERQPHPNPTSWMFA